MNSTSENTRLNALAEEVDKLTVTDRSQLKDIAEQYALGRTLYILEGGYVADNISKSVNEILGVLVKNKKK